MLPAYVVLHFISTRQTGVFLQVFLWESRSSAVEYLSPTLLMQAIGRRAVGSNPTGGPSFFPSFFCLTSRREKRCQRRVEIHSEGDMPRDRQPSGFDVSRAAVQCLVLQGGVKRLLGDLYNKGRCVLNHFVRDVLRKEQLLAHQSRHKTVSRSDVVEALRRRGVTYCS